VGDTYVGGSNWNPGAVYVFTKSKGIWLETQKLTASDGTKDNGFGGSVVIGGDLVIIGAGGAKVNDDYRGAVYVFKKSGDSFVQVAKLTANDGATADFFGYSLAISNSNLIVDAPYANNAEGAVYVFTKSEGSWSQTAKLTAGNGDLVDGFGRSLALSGATALIGTNVYANGNWQGAVYVYTKSGGAWTKTATLAANDGTKAEGFGSALALNGTTAIVGAPEESVNGNFSQGAAYVFTKSGNSWDQTQKLTANNGTSSNNFGKSIAADAKEILIGADAGDNVQEHSGSAYLFEISDGSWEQVLKFTASDRTAYDDFGFSVALDHSTALIGADQGDALNGAAYFYSASDLGLAVSAPQTIYSGQQFSSQTIATNNSSAASPAVAVSIAVPAAASFVSATATQGDCNEATGVVRCVFGAIDGNAGMATANVKFKTTGNVNDTIKQVAGIAKATPALTASASTIVQKANQPPVASDGTLTTKENTVASGTLMASDPDGDPLTFSIVDKPMHGSVKLDDASKETYTYTPNKGYSGSDSFTFKANDGQADSNVANISITVKETNSPPVAEDGKLTTKENTAASDTLMASDPDDNPLTFAIVDKPLHGSADLGDNGVYTYTPNNGYSGSDSFTFKANDGQADSNTATISITIMAAPPPPPPPPSGGGGGGSNAPLSLGLLAVIGLLVLLRRRP
jgi:dTDP-4-dehydrorhamnose 3,5-epimerase-like enzyme